MANVRRTAREIRLEAIVELQNELNQLKNEEPVSALWIQKFDGYKLYELGDVKERLMREIAATKQEQLVQAYFAGEGQALKEEIERRKQAIRDEFVKIQNEIQELAEESFEGTPWHINYTEVNSYRATIKVNLRDEEGKDIHATEVSLNFDKSWYREDSNCFETNIGTTGNFSLLDDSIGSRTNFYIQFGNLLKNKGLLEKIRDTMEQLVSRHEENSKSYQKVKNVEKDPFNIKF